MKKGQIYILTSLILIILLYSMSQIVNKVSQEQIQGDFKQLSENYATEGARLVNDVMKKGSQDTVIRSFRDFTRSFTSYSKTKSSEFGLIYAFYYTGTDKDKNKGKVYIGNYLNMPILVSYSKPDYTYIAGCYSEIPTGAGFDGITLSQGISETELADCEKTVPEDTEASINELYITIGGYAYTFDVSPDQLQIIIVSREDNADQRQVFVDGNFLTTEEDTTVFSEYCQAGGTTGCQGDTVICSAAYLTQDDCKRDPACKWNKEAEVCENA